MNMHICSFLLVFYFCSYFTEIQCQERDPPVELVLENEGYPIFSSENVTQRKNQNCSCQLPLPRGSEWNAWSVCQGQRGAFECHRGIRYRRRICTDRLVDQCTTRQWQYCYHQASCSGQWVEWFDPSSNASCTRPCGGGVQIKIRICTREKEIGLYCESNQRRPYDVTYLPCNMDACPAEIAREEPIADLPPIEESNTSSSRPLSESSFSPNLSTWVVLGICIVVILLSVGSLAVCLASERRTRIRMKRDLIKKGTTVEMGYQQLNYDGKSNENFLTDSSKTLQPKQSPKIENLQNDPPRRNSMEEGASPKQPERPAILHHSFYNGNAVPSERAVYTLPSPSTSSHLNKWTSADNVEASTYIETRTFFADNYEDKDLPPIPQEACDYMETITEQPEERQNHTLSSYHNHDIPKDDSKTLYSFAPDVHTIKSSRTVDTRDNNHIYAEIPIKRLPLADR